MAFANGGMLIVVDKAVMQDVELLGKLVEATKATILSTVPTLLATIDANYLRTLELVIAGGEACNKEVVAAYATGGKRRFVNSYGPTEATVACMADYSTPDRPVTIGRPQPGYFACIVNSRMELVPPGVPGELCMAGPSVARGYVNRPELTAEKFAHCPYVSRWREGFPEYDDATANDETYYRLYHTGDLTRWNHEGRVEFLGRIDSQVKLRGFRIEVGEIETNLAAYPGVRTAIVHLLDEGGKQYLCGYLMCDDELKANFVEHKFRDFLKDKLPSYMIPSRFCLLDVVPRSPAGKLDRKQLKPPPPLAQVEDEGTEKVAPTTETEILLHRLWSELFPGQRIGTTDDFFQIGGHSLLAGKLASKIRLAGYPDFGIRLVYSNATILALAATVDVMTKEEPAAPTMVGGRAVPPAPLKLPDRFQPGCLRKILFGVYQFIIFTFAVALQWAYLMFFFFLYYGRSHDAVADLVQSRGAVFYIFFGIVMQFFFIATNFALAFVVSPLMKWAILQRVKPGEHSIWSVYFLRWWTCRTMHHLVAPTCFLMYGTYLYNLQLTLLGAKLGSSCTILTAMLDPDLIEMGDDCFVGDNVTLGTSQVIDSMLVLNKVIIGNCCSVGARSSIVGGAILEDEIVLGPLSLVRHGVVIPTGEKWQGSPAQKVGYVPRLGQMQSIDGDTTQLKNNDNGWSPIDAPVNDAGGLDTELLEGMSIRLPGFIRFLIGVLHLIFYFFLQLFVTNVIGILTFGSWIICDELASRNELWYASVYILMAPFLTGIIMFYQHCVIILLRWIVFPWSPQPGMYPCDGLMFHRKILLDMLSRVSLQYAHPMYSTIFTQYFLRAMGVKVGRRLECSNLFGWTPGLTTIGDECFVADFVGVNPSDCFRGVLRLDHVKIGDRAFIGNGSVLMPGISIGERAPRGPHLVSREPHRRRQDRHRQPGVRDSAPDLRRQRRPGQDLQPYQDARRAPYDLGDVPHGHAGDVHHRQRCLRLRRRRRDLLRRPDVDSEGPAPGTPRHLRRPGAPLHLGRDGVQYPPHARRQVDHHRRSSRRGEPLVVVRRVARGVRRRRVHRRRQRRYD
jgi:acetyltransferase-like isoleucine patch superfamily enzyme